VPISVTGDTFTVPAEASTVQRRTVLRTLGGLGTAALAGCAGFCLGDRPNPPESGVYRRVTVADEGSVPEGADLETSVSMTEATVTREHPARFELAIRNTGAPRATTAGVAEMCGLFDREEGGSRPPALWVHPVEEARHLDRPDGRFLADRPTDEQRNWPDYGCLPRQYDAGETVRGEYAVWHDYRQCGYFPTGTYRFEDTVSVWNSMMERTGTPNHRFTWGPTLRVSKPE